MYYRFKKLFAEKEGEEKGEGKRVRKAIFIFIFIFLIFEMSSFAHPSLRFSSHLSLLLDSLLFFSLQFSSFLQLINLPTYPLTNKHIGGSIGKQKAVEEGDNH